MAPKFICSQTKTIAITCFALALLNGNANAAITIQSVDIVARAEVFTTQPQKHFQDTNILTPPSASELNIDASHSTAPGWYASSRNTIEFSENSGQTTLLVNIDSHEKSGGGVSAGTAAGIFAGYSSYGAPLVFTTDVDTPYSLSGEYAMDGPATGIFLGVWLSDVTPGYEGVVFRNEQNSFSAASESFTLGQTGGDYLNILTPSASSISGTLLANHTYSWSFAAYMPTSSTTSTADGYIQLVLGEVTPGVVPEAASAVIWLVMGLTATWNHRRRDRN